MASRVVTLPNVLTVVRMALIPVFVGALYHQRFGWALAVFVAAGITDGLDGLFARRFNQYSQLGQILAVVLILIAASFAPLRGSLPTVYTTVFSFAVISGIHYVFWASKLLNEDRQQRETAQ